MSALAVALRHATPTIRYYWKDSDSACEAFVRELDAALAAGDERRLEDAAREFVRLASWYWQLPNREQDAALRPVLAVLS